jgi:hypothetical protein
MQILMASLIIQEFLRMVGWKYVWGGAREGIVDCSGAFSFAYKRLGSWMYHGSHTMYTRYCYDKGKIGAVELLPSQPVFKERTVLGIWNVYHVGDYIGGGWVIEAKGRLYGVIVSRIEEWHLTGKLRSRDGGTVQYDVKEVLPVIVNAQVVTSTGKAGSYVNLRSGSSALNPRVAKMPHGTQVQVMTEVPVNKGWCAVKFGSFIGCADAQYVKLLEPVPTLENRVKALEDWRKSLGA